MYHSYLNDAIAMIEKLVNIPSPSGFSSYIMKYLKNEFETLGYVTEITPSDALLIHVEGLTTDSEHKLCLAAHTDTLGAMVSAITPSGYLKLTNIGGYMMQSIEGEYCTIHCRSNQQTFTGTILTSQPSVHVYDDARTQERSIANMEIRLDEKVFSDKDVRALGIEVGDYISFEPHFTHTKSGFIKSRHLDDKASIGIIYAVLKYMKEQQIKPARDFSVLLTNFEEVGIGASWIPSDITHMLSIDMGAVGADLNGDEYHVSICAKDSSGPYSYQMTNNLISLAKTNELPYVIDIFPHYGSDVSAARRAGQCIQGALIGQGVHASHGMERTHEEGLYATMRLIMHYIEI